MVTLQACSVLFNSRKRKFDVGERKEMEAFCHKCRIANIDRINIQSRTTNREPNHNSIHSTMAFGFSFVITSRIRVRRYRNNFFKNGRVYDLVPVVQSELRHTFLNLPQSNGNRFNEILNNEIGSKKLRSNVCQLW